MYVSVKPVNFTDEELGKIYNILSDTFDDLSELIDEANEDPYASHECDIICKTLNDIKAMMHKISDNGIFSND